MLLFACPWYDYKISTLSANTDCGVSFGSGFL